MRRIMPLASMRCMRAITSSASMPSCSASAWYGRGTSGRPPWLARMIWRSTASGIRLSLTAFILDFEFELDEILVQFGHVEDMVAGIALDLLDGGLLPLRRFRRQHEPHVEIMLAFV